MLGSGGDQSCQWFNRGSKSSAPLWDILLSWRHISARRPKNKHCFSSGSQLSLMYNLRGLSYFIVRRPERTICWGWWNRKRPHRTLSATMRVCGSVCVRYFTWTRIQRRVVGDSFNAVVSGRHGVEGRFQSGHVCVLGELGRLHAMIFQRHPDVATAFVQELEGAPEGALGALARATTSLTGVCGFEPPTWQALIEGTRPSPVEPEALEPGGDRGWQHVVSSKVEHEHREVVFGRLRPSARAQVRSQAGPGAGLALSATPTHFLTRIPSHLFRVVMLRRLRLPLPPSLHTCRCGRRINKFGQCGSPSVPRSRRESHPECHGVWLGPRRTTACRRTAAWGSRGWPPTVRWMPARSGRHHRQRSPLRRFSASGSWEHRWRGPWESPTKKGADLPVGREGELVWLCWALKWGAACPLRRDHFCPSWPKLVLDRKFPLMRKRAEQAWRMRWGAIVSCTSARAVASSLLNVQSPVGVDGDTLPTHEVERDHRFSGLVPWFLCHFWDRSDSRTVNSWPKKKLWGQRTILLFNIVVLNVFISADIAQSQAIIQIWTCHVVFWKSDFHVLQFPRPRFQVLKLHVGKFKFLKIG